MYKHIEYNKEHKKVLIPKEINTKLKMLGAVATMSGLVLSFSGCNSVKENVKQTSIAEQTSYIQAMGEGTAESKTEEINYDIEENEPSTYVDQQSDNENYSYDNLLNNLKEVLSKKDFSEEAKLLILDTFDNLYKNYETWQKCYYDMPSLQDYIKNNFIDVIEQIGKIEFIDKDSKEGQRLLDNGSALGITTLDESNNLLIRIIANKKENSDIMRDSDIEIFFHEVAHCKQKKIVFYTFGGDYFKNDEELQELILDGGATFHEKFVNPYTTDIYGSWSISNEAGDITIDYNKDNCLGYLTNLNAYEKLIYLVGYNLIDKVEQGKVPLSTVKDVIAQKYGKEKAEYFWQTLKDWYCSYEDNWQSDETYDLAVELENSFLDFVKMNFEVSNSTEEFEQNKKLYKYYKQKNMPKVTSSEGRDITDEIFNIKEIDEIIAKSNQEWER